MCLSIYICIECFERPAGGFDRKAAEKPMKWILMDDYFMDNYCLWMIILWIQLKSIKPIIPESFDRKTPRGGEGEIQRERERDLHLYAS